MTRPPKRTRLTDSTRRALTVVAPAILAGALLLSGAIPTRREKTGSTPRVGDAQPATSGGPSRPSVQLSARALTRGSIPETKLPTSAYRAQPPRDDANAVLAVSSIIDHRSAELEALALRLERAGNTDRAHELRRRARRILDHRDQLLRAARDREAGKHGL